MKFAVLFVSLSLANAFQIGSVSRSAKSETSSIDTRKDFLIKSLSGAAALITGLILGQPEPASARGRATLEKSYQRYAPRIREGGEFYGKDLRQLVAKNDWVGIKNALQEPPERQKADLNKPDAGVAERAKQAGGFSDARVLVAADLFAGAFSDNSISAKTKKMQASIAKVRKNVEGMESVAKQALGEESGGGLFGLGKSKPNEAELAKKLREYYVEGGNAWNEYVFAANDDLALQFDRFPFVKG